MPHHLLKAASLFLAILIIVFALGAWIEAASNCEGGVLVRTAVGGVICFREAP